MKKDKITFDYEKLLPLDIVHCAGRSPLAFVTRIVTAGFKNKRNYGISVHTGILVDFHGQLLVSEMQAKGLEINSLERYSKVGGRRWVINITRPPINELDRIIIQKEIAIDRRRTIEYDYKGLLEFVFKKVKDNKNKNYCSEYVHKLTEDYIEYPESFKVKVSPLELQTFKVFKPVDWRK